MANPLKSNGFSLSTALSSSSSSPFLLPSSMASHFSPKPSSLSMSPHSRYILFWRFQLWHFGLVIRLGFPVNFPNGRTFFRRSTGRLSDGRLIIDLLCKSPHSTTTLSLFFIGYRGCEVGSDLPFTWLGVSVKARALNGIWCASWLINGADFAYGASFFFHRGGGRQCALVPYFKWSEFTRMCACT